MNGHIEIIHYIKQKGGEYHAFLLEHFNQTEIDELLAEGYLVSHGFHNSLTLHPKLIQILRKMPEIDFDKLKDLWYDTDRMNKLFENDKY